MGARAGRCGGSLRRASGWFAWVGVLLVVAGGGGALGRGALSPPPVTDPSAWAAWASGRTPLESSFAVLGLVVVVLAWYLLVVTLLTVAARLQGGRQLMSLVALLTLPVVRRSLHTALGIGLVGTSVTGVAGAEAFDRPVVAIAARPAAAAGVAPPGAGAGEPIEDTAGEADPPVMRLLPEEVPDDDAAIPAPHARPASQPVATKWEVRPGDHLWSVAARVLDQAGAVTESDRDVALYWRRLVEANAERLVDPANPDLIYPGQVLVLPSPAPPDGRALP